MTIAGCTAQTKNSDKIDGDTLTIYSSMPLVGADKPRGQAIVNGIKQAWEERGHRAGKFKIKYISLDDATVAANQWTPEQTFNNAQKAVDDDKTIIYIGELNSGATAISLPVLNKEGIPQIGPGSTAVGLTTKDPGAATGEPDKYYPSEKRTYVRPIQRDTVQGKAMATLMKQKGCKSLAILNDGGVYGDSFAKTMESQLRPFGIRLLEDESIDPEAKDYTSEVQKLKQLKPDCFLFAGSIANNAVQVVKEVAAALPGVQLYGPDGIAKTAFVASGTGVPASVADRMLVTAPTLPASEYGPAAKKFFDGYAKRYGHPPEDPFAIYGYEAMNLGLDAINNAGNNGNNRKDVLKQLLVQNRQSPLGVYSINANGDTSLSYYGVYTFRDGKLAFQKKIDTAER